MDQNKYRHFQLDDFLRDESFRKWALRLDDKDDAQWRAFLQACPEKRAQVEEARRLLEALQRSFQYEEAGQEEIASAFDKLKQAAVQNENRSGKAPATIRRRSLIWSAAAALALLITGGFVYWFLSVQQVDTPLQYATDFGERRTIKLPDGSQVQLNANSTLTLADGWRPGHTREVRLEGEAFFAVASKADGSRFIVHAGGLNVEVLGTQFNVNTRNRQTKVVLEEGKVKLNLDEQAPEKSIVMTPGEIVEYDAEQRTLDKRLENTQSYTSWKDGVLVFEATSLAELAQRIEEIYGVEVRFENPSLEDQQVKLFAPIDDFEEFIETLQIVLDGDNISIEKESDDVLLIK